MGKKPQHNGSRRLDIVIPVLGVIMSKANFLAQQLRSAKKEESRLLIRLDFSRSWRNIEEHSIYHHERTTE